MSTPIRPWTSHRHILCALAIFGLVVLVYSLGMAWVLQGGFGPGAHTSPPDLADLVGTGLLAVPCVYYIVVAQRVWTRKLWVAGIVIHLLVLVLIVAVVLGGRGRSLAALPFLLGGPVAWKALGPLGYRRRCRRLHRLADTVDLPGTRRRAWLLCWHHPASRAPGVFRILAHHTDFAGRSPGYEFFTLWADLPLRILG